MVENVVTVIILFCKHWGSTVHLTSLVFGSIFFEGLKMTR